MIQSGANLAAGSNLSIAFSFKEPYFKLPHSFPSRAVPPFHFHYPVTAVTRMMLIMRRQRGWGGVVFLLVLTGQSPRHAWS